MLILASGSPRRRELLEQIGLQFEVIISQKEEIPTEVQPKDLVMELAKVKAEDVWDRLDPEKYGTGTVVLGADTVVALDNEIMGKPKDDEDAFRMLTLLAGRTHQVYTGVTIIYVKDNRQTEYTFYEKTDVEMYPMSSSKIRAYVATKEPLDKAGAYAIQGRCGAFIKSISGEYANVVGLPIGRLFQELSNRDLLEKDVF